MAKEKNKRQDKEKGKTPIMNTKLFEYILQIVKNITDLCNKAADAADSENYAAAVNALDQPLNDTYAAMRRLIEQDETLSTSEKLEKLDELAQRQQKTQQMQEEAINGNREHIKDIALEIFAALATCGLSVIPKIFHKRKNASVTASSNDLLEVQTPTDQIEESGCHDEELTTV